MDEKKEFTYEIGDKVYVQRPLVLAQVGQLISLLKGVVIPKNISAIEFIDLLGDRLPNALAVVLSPQDLPIKDKELRVIASDIGFSILPGVVLEVIENFFDLNPLSSILQKLNGMMGKMAEKMAATGLNISSASSREEISPGKKASSGDTP